MAKTLFNGASFKNTTSCFTFKSYVKGNSLRLRFNNRSGKKPVKIGSIVLWKNQKAYHVNLSQNTSFEIPIAAWVYSDILNLPIEMDDEIEVRIYFASSVCDLNHTEMNARAKSNRGFWGLHHRNESLGESAARTYSSSVSISIPTVWAAEDCGCIQLGSTDGSRG